MIEKGIEPPPRTQIAADVQEADKYWQSWLRWIKKLADAIPKIQTFTVAINPASVGANTTAEQAVTVNGLSTADIVFLNKPSHTTGLIIGNVRVSAANTLSVTFANVTAAPIDAAQETYKLVAIRL